MSSQRKEHPACNSIEEYHPHLHSARRVRWIESLNGFSIEQTMKITRNWPKEFEVVAARGRRITQHIGRRNLHRAFEDDVDVWMVIGRPNVMKLLISVYQELAIHTIFKIFTRRSLYNTLLRIGSPVFSGSPIHTRQNLTVPPIQKRTTKAFHSSWRTDELVWFYHWLSSSPLSGVCLSNQSLGDPSRSLRFVSCFVRNVLLHNAYKHLRTKLEWN